MSKAQLFAPLVNEMLVIPVAGEDSMLLNLSGAHGPMFTRNIVILRDNAGHIGAGEVPGGNSIRQTLDERDRWLSGSQLRPTTPSSIKSAWSLLTATVAGAVNKHLTLER